MHLIHQIYSTFYLSNTVHYRLPVASSYDHVVDCELWVMAAIQHFKKVSYCVLIAQEKIKVKNLKYGFY